MLVLISKPHNPFSLLNAHCSPDGKGRFLTSRVGRLLSVLRVTLPEVFPCIESDWISLMLFPLSSLNDFCLFVIVLLVSSFLVLIFVRSFLGGCLLPFTIVALKSYLSFWRSTIFLLWILKFFFLMIEIWFCGGLQLLRQENKCPERA